VMQESNRMSRRSDARVAYVGMPATVGVLGLLVGLAGLREWLRRAACVEIRLE
jgi:hypothetical protein